MALFHLQELKLKFARVAIDYYTKWVEANPLSMITEHNITEFVWKKIICWFRVPHTLVSNHTTQFNNARFRELCIFLGIRKIFSSLAHPQANRKVESLNKDIKRMLKKNLTKRKRAWVDGLSLVLWSYRTTH